MSKHRMVDGRLLQMNKKYGQLKQKQKQKISGWMYEAYRKQAEENLSDEEALQLVFDRIEDAKIWIPEHEIVSRYRAKKNQFKKRLAGENIPQHIYAMENIASMLELLAKPAAVDFQIYDEAIHAEDSNNENFKNFRARLCEEMDYFSAKFDSKNSFHSSDFPRSSRATLNS